MQAGHVIPNLQLIEHNHVPSVVLFSDLDCFSIRIELLLNSLLHAWSRSLPQFRWSAVNYLRYQSVLLAVVVVSTQYFQDSPTPSSIHLIILARVWFFLCYVLFRHAQVPCSFK